MNMLFSQFYWATPCQIEHRLTCYFHDTTENHSVWAVICLSFPFACACSAELVCICSQWEFLLNSVHFFSLANLNDSSFASDRYKIVKFRYRSELYRVQSWWVVFECFIFRTVDVVKWCACWLFSAHIVPAWVLALCAFTNWLPVSGKWYGAVAYNSITAMCCWLIQFHRNCNAF